MPKSINFTIDCEKVNIDGWFSSSYKLYDSNNEEIKNIVFIFGLNRRYNKILNLNMSLIYNNTRILGADFQRSNGPTKNSGCPNCCIRFHTIQGSHFHINLGHRFVFKDILDSSEFKKLTSTFKYFFKVTNINYDEVYIDTILFDYEVMI